MLCFSCWGILSSLFRFPVIFSVSSSHAQPQNLPWVRFGGPRTSVKETDKKQQENIGQHRTTLENIWNMRQQRKDVENIRKHICRHGKHRRSISDRTCGLTHSHTKTTPPHREKPSAPPPPRAPPRHNLEDLAYRVIDSGSAPEGDVRRRWDEVRWGKGEARWSEVRWGPGG